MALRHSSDQGDSHTYTRREFLRKTGGVAVLTPIALPFAAFPGIPIAKRALERCSISHPRVNFEKLPSDETIIGRPFRMEYTDDGGGVHTVDAMFTDAMTLQVEGATYPMNCIRVPEKTIRPDSKLGDSDTMIKDGISSIERSGDGDGILFKTEYGDIQLPKKELSRICGALSTPAEAGKTSKDIPVEFDVQLSTKARVAYLIGRAAQQIPPLPSSGTITFQIPPEKQIPLPPDQVQQVASNNKRGLWKVFATGRWLKASGENK